jgi:hypothetical protein
VDRATDRVICEATLSQVIAKQSETMARADRLYSRLDTLEVTFAEQLHSHLLVCIEGRDDLLFCSREFFPAHYPKCLSTQVGDELLELAEKIRGLRVKAGEPFRASLAWRFREACRHWADTSDPHRGAAQTIAKNLLCEVESQQSKPAT